MPVNRFDFGNRLNPKNWTTQCWLVFLAWLSFAIWQNFPSGIDEFFWIDGAQVSQADIVKEYKVVSTQFGWPLPYAEYSIRENLPSLLRPFILLGIADVILVASSLLSVAFLMQEHAKQFSIKSMLVLIAVAAIVATLGKLIFDSANYGFFNVFLIVIYLLPICWLGWEVLGKGEVEGDTQTSELTR